MMKVSWDTKFLGTFHAKVADEDVLAFIGDLASLGFNPRVEMLDNPSEN